MPPVSTLAPSGPILPLSTNDLPIGRGPGKVVGTDDLAAPSNPAIIPQNASGSDNVGFDDTRTGSPLGANTVQGAIDVLKGSGAPSVALNEYYVDTTQAANAALRLYPTVALAVAAAEVVGLPYVVRLRETQGHTWDGTGFTGLVDATITCLGDKQATLGLLVGGLLGTAQITFARLLLNHSAAFTAAAGASVAFETCRVVSLGGQPFTGFSSVNGRNSEFIGTRFLLIGVTVAIGGLFQHCSWSPGAGFPASSTLMTLSSTNVTSLIHCDIDTVGADDLVLFNRTANNPGLHLKGTTLTLENAGVGNTVLFNSASLAVTLRNVQCTRKGVGIVNIGAGVLDSVSGFTWYGTSPDDNLLPASTLRNDFTDTTAAPGAAASNAASGRAAIALGASSCVITNPYVTATSRVLATLQSVDGTLLYIQAVVCAPGSFTVSGNANAAAAAAFAWTIVPG